MRLRIEIDLDDCPTTTLDPYIARALYHVAESIELGNMCLDDLEHVAMPLFMEGRDDHIGYAEILEDSDDE